MKGVILSIAPRTIIVDISHGVPKQDILAAAYVLKSSYKYFPPGTIHIAVVDPGVGTNRRSIVLKTRNYVFVGPDNG
ncbi:MAG: SAM-dependent chlorinase/fluorinase, partial [Thermofilaceae archaeon]|nr:SAM-dependent chlorinase/fluorinase [Thermofilaceae archaeon]